MDENTYAEKIIAKNSLATPAQLAKAKSAAAGGTTLLQSLREQGALTEDNASQIAKMFQQWKAKNPTPAVVQAPAARPPASGTEPARRPLTIGSDVASAAGSVALRAPGGATGAPGNRISSAALSPATPPQRANVPPATGGPSTFNHLHHYLEFARKSGASDLHINVACAPMVRKDGKLATLQRGACTPEETEKLLFEILSDAQRKALKKDKSLDFCYTMPGGSRYRSCIVHERLGWDGSFRVIQSKVPTFEELGLPEQLKRLTEFHQGLVLVTGPNGCGKSTTLAAMVDLINKTRDEHIITIEDPVEYTYVPEKSHVNQREVGQNTKSFGNALRAALREDPDVIVIGELRDKETVSLAITAAETGHLVFGTLHTTSAGRTIDRVLDVFSPEEQGQIRSMISESIKGIICQQLIPRKNGQGRVLAMEILFNTPAAANLIRERKIFQLPSVLQTGRKQGMVLLDDSLLKLVNEGQIEGLDAFFAADNKTVFQKWAPQGF